MNGKNDMRIKRKIGVLVILGMFMTLALSTSVTAVFDPDDDIDMDDTQWIGLGSTEGRIIFDDEATDEIEIANARLGIGTTTPDTKLHVMTSGQDHHIRVQRIDYDPQLDLIAGGSWVGIDCISTSSELFSIWNDGTAVFHIRENNNVGIGTVSPDGPFEIEEPGTVGSNLDIMLLTNTGSASTGMIGTETSILFNQEYYAITPSVVDAGRIAVGTETSWTGSGLSQDSYMAFHTATQGTVREAVRITSNGYVGIGIATPRDPLEVVGDASADRFVARTDAEDVEFADQDGTDGMKIENSDDYPNIWIGDYSVESTSFKGIYMDGYLQTTSIGTADTRSRLVVASKDSADDALRLLGPDGGATAWGARLNFGDLEKVYIEEDADNKLYIHADSRIALMGSNVGIGEATPLTKLYVDGDVAFGDGSELTISSGAVTATHTFHTIDTESDDNSDDLYIISGGDVTGQLLTIRAEHTDRTVVAKDGGNMQLSGDFSMDNVQDTLVLIYDSDLSSWLELSRSNNGT